MSSALTIPAALADLIRTGVWPTVESANAQHLRPLADQAAINSVAPEESTLFLESPPFRTLSSEVATSQEFWEEHGALNEIEPDLALVIGDFGLGSDSAIVLDYRRSSTEPSVKRLLWTANGNHWVEVAPTFEAFATALRLG